MKGARTEMPESTLRMLVDKGRASCCSHAGFFWRLRPNIGFLGLLTIVYLGSAAALHDAAFAVAPLIESDSALTFRAAILAVVDE
jgi:hypothetical protein